MASRLGAGQNGDRSEPEVPTATNEDLDLVRTVCQIVVRQFYQDQHVILIDVLSRHLVMPAEILAKALGVPVREMMQIANLLVRDRLINVFRRSETKESGPSNFVRQNMRSYMYLDRKVFLDVTKWRIMKMRSQIDSVLRNELDNKGYMCPRCGKSFSTLDVAALLDPVTMLVFICDVPGCGSELVDNEDAEDVKRSKDRQKRFNEQCAPILDRLRKLDTVALPHFDLMAEISKKGDSDAWIRRALRKDPNLALDDVAFAKGGAKAGPAIEVDMIQTNPELEAQRRLEKEAEAARKRQENALPGWWQETQDPNAPRLAKQELPDGSSLSQIDTASASNGKSSESLDDYYAQYASMAKEEEGEEDGAELELEEVTVNGSASLTGTPRTNGKRSREESEDDNDVKRTKVAETEQEGAEDDDNFDLEEVA